MPTITVNARKVAHTALQALSLILPLLATGQGIEIRQLALTHSGAYDFYTINGQAAGDSLYPYVSRMAQAGGHIYRLDGTFGPLFDPSNPNGSFVAEVQGALQDGFISQWRRDSDTPLDIDNVPGTTLGEKAYTSFMFSPRNFVGFWFDETSGQILLNDQGVPEGINPENDPDGFQEIVTEYVNAINRVAQEVPSALIHVYEFLPPAFAFPHTEDPLQDNTIAQSHIDAYVAHALGRHQSWLDALVAGIRNHPGLNSNATIVPVGINRIIAALLRDHPELLVGRDWFDFARDGAPHFGDVEGSSDFFEAFLAPVLYGVLFAEAVPSNFSLEGGNIFADDFPLIRNYVATALDADTSGGGSGGSSGGSSIVTRVEDTDPAWTRMEATPFDPTLDGLPAAENSSVLSLYSGSSQVQLNFSGTGIRLFGLVFPGANSGQISLNGDTPVALSWQADSAAPGALLWESASLPEGDHSLTIESDGDWIAIDYVEVIGGDAIRDGSGSSGGGGTPGSGGGGAPALSGTDLGLLGTFSHSAWGDRVPLILEDAVDAANTAAGSIRFQVQYGSGLDAHVALLPDGDPTVNGGAGVNIATAARLADAEGSDVTLFGIGYLASYIPDAENPPNGGYSDSYGAHQFVDLPADFSGPLTLESVVDTAQVNVPYNLARIAVASQADVIWNTPVYPALNELADPFTRLNPASYVAELRERITTGAIGTANAFALLEASAANYSGEIRLFTVPNDLLIAWIEQAPAWLEGNATRIAEVRSLVDHAAEPSLAAAYSEADFLAYPQDSLFVDGGGHFSRLPHIMFAHAILLTRLADIDPAFLEEDLSTLVQGDLSADLASFVHSLTVQAVSDQMRFYGETGGSASPVVPEITRPDVVGAHEFVVAADGSGLTDSIQASVNAAQPGDTIRVRAGTYAESVRIETNNLRVLAEGTVEVTGNANATHGFYIEGDDVELRGFTVSGIHGYAFPSDHAATGFVLNGARTRLINCVSHSNGYKGFLILPEAEEVLIQGGSAYDNSAAGIGVAGGSAITIRDMAFYSTGEDGGADGSFQASAIISDNWGDFGHSARLPIEGVQPITGLTIDNVRVYDHPDYGIRISAYNETLSAFPSGRISTANLEITNSHISNNGSRLSDFVGGLYHLGGVLIQHVDGGLVAGNVMENNYFWGIDAYRCNDVIYRDNWFLNNNRGMDTPGITFEPVNVEINGGLRNTFSNNLVYGSFSGLFLSWIPDSDDGPFFGPDSITVEHNIMAGHTEGGFSMVVNNDGLSSRTIRNNFIQQVDTDHLAYLREDLNIDLNAQQLGNVIGVAPGFNDAPNGDFGLMPGSPLESNSWGPANLRASAPSGDFDSWILDQLGTNSPAADRSATANPDGDSRPNLIDYATGGRADQHDSGAPLDVSQSSGSTASLDLVLRGNDPSLQTRIRYSHDLQSWTTVELFHSGGTWQTNSATVTVESARDLGGGLWQLSLRLPATGRSVFARLSVERVL